MKARTPPRPYQDSAIKIGLSNGVDHIMLVVGATKYLIGNAMGVIFSLRHSPFWDLARLRI